MSDGERSRLVVLKDGAALADDEARAMWMAFSAHMDEHQGDMAGFAKLYGFVEVRPEYRKGQAVLVASTTAEEAAKAAAPPPKAKPAAKKGASKQAAKKGANAKKPGGAAPASGAKAGKKR